jgi:hypothetical protein
MRPRSPEVLLQRLSELNRSDIAVGGVLGARHYFPGLDLVGTPRLDLVVHSTGIGGGSRKQMDAPHRDLAKKYFQILLA